MARQKILLAPDSPELLQAYKGMDRVDEPEVEEVADSDSGEEEETDSSLSDSEEDDSDGESQDEDETPARAGN
ncbi:hypothetical protein TsFJ059_002678 [Trichoderma semiorbis]|uniref:Uncharacterized protein n=1 Tax=Trichoderma semiorbis TaxID=1491008 RepID=A0A9P8KUX2_9HYPO|nr:hypothetical protein TsFJ059_002678 [Trichoderma semiorbis]